jgi:hypothetical protein
MAHLHYIEDTSGDVIDYKAYCSDYCHRESIGANYGGWNGCNEISTSQPCENCGETVNGLDED